MDFVLWNKVICKTKKPRVVVAVTLYCVTLLSLWALWNCHVSQCFVKLYLANHSFLWRIKYKLSLLRLRVCYLQEIHVKHGELCWNGDHELHAKCTRASCTCRPHSCPRNRYGNILKASRHFRGLFYAAIKAILVLPDARYLLVLPKLQTSRSLKWT